MADFDITLTYAPNGSFTAAPFSIAVRQGQTISFHLAPGSQDGIFRITFHDPQFFTTGNPHFHQNGVFLHGDGVVHVAARLPGRTTYHCELLDPLNPQGPPKAQSHENQGGEMVPVS